jgi:GT2 family glycosyltransferase
MKSEQLSVIVATRDRCEHLAAMLSSYASEWQDTRELLVVDNGSRDGTAALLERLERSHPKLASLHVAQRGKSVAMNRGISATTGAYVAFLDDDVIVQPGWARAYVSAFEQESCAGFQGRIVLAADARNDPTKAALARRYKTLPITELDADHAAVRVLIGANMAVRREALTRAGGFDEMLGPGRTGFGEDTKLGRAIRASGGELEYVAAACVEHVYDAGRMTEAFFEDYHRRMGRGRFAEKHHKYWTSVVPNLIAATVRSRVARLFRAEETYYRNRARYFAYSEMLRMHRAPREQA